MSLPSNYHYVRTPKEVIDCEPSLNQSEDGKLRRIDLFMSKELYRKVLRISKKLGKKYEQEAMEFFLEIVKLNPDFEIDITKPTDDEYVFMLYQIAMFYGLDSLEEMANE